MEALGDAISFGKAPHSDNRIKPGTERRGQGFGRALIRVVRGPEPLKEAGVVILVLRVDVLLVAVGID